MFGKKIAIDLGTANTIVHFQGKGIVVNEPSVVAISQDNKIIAIGTEAKTMLGKTPDIISAHRPLQDGVIADYRITEAMLKYFINKAIGRFRIRGPEVMISAPAGITSTERRAVIDATKSAGAKEAFIIKEPLAAAIGANIPVADPLGNLVVDIGGGTTEVAVISLGGIVESASVRVGGNKIDQAIQEYVRKKYNLSIGDRTAEEIKINIGSAVPMKTQDEMNIRGRDLVGGLPKTISVQTNEVADAIQDELEKIIQTIKQVLERTPPELSADIIDHGMIMTGGGSLLRNLPELLTHHTGIPSYTADDAMFCVVRGIAVALENLPAFKRTLISSK